eukprot:NODE_812_length_3739_cov_0.536813.p1 type:complete len:415 gc:universal NODE_812_length_3739_cov_0.536813:1191-2435(+)
MSSFGTIFKVTTFGESHCKGVGCIVENCPPGLPLKESDIQPQLTRRRPGQSDLTTPRDEKDRVQILSGTEYGVTLGTPIGLFVPNEDFRPKDYSETDEFPRPSHADWTYLLKYGLKASSGGGRSSARETIGRVASGAIAEQYLKLVHGVEIVAFVSSVGPLEIPNGINQNNIDYANVPVGTDVEYQNVIAKEFMDLLNTVTREEVDADITRCPHKETSSKIIDLIRRTRDAKNSIGGTVTCVIRNVPTGLGEPCFDKLSSKLAHAMMSIPATKGFELGSGFKGTELFGSMHNDAWVKNEKGGLKTVSNNSGGTQGGISNGEHVYFRVAFKPPATIGIEQKTSSYEGQDGILAARGRHDPCVVPRAVAIVESMAALTLMDALMLQNSRALSFQNIPDSVIETIEPRLRGLKPTPK